jgi:hypothetical protein
MGFPYKNQRIRFLPMLRRAFDLAWADAKQNESFFAQKMRQRFSLPHPDLHARPVFSPPVFLLII